MEPVIINNPLSKKGVVAIPKDKLIRKTILETAFGTHKDLSNADVNFVVDEILKMELNNQQLTNVVLQVYQLSNTGRFSLTYNMDLNSHIKIKDTERINTLADVAGTNKAWPELYNNHYLTDQDKKVIEEMANREYYAILNTLETGNDDNLNNILPCEMSTDNILSLTDSDIKYTTVYSKCYDNVCISEATQRGKIINMVGSKSDSDIPQVAYVADMNNGVGTKYCFKIMDIIERLAKGDYINPRTGTMFSEIALSQLLYKYDKEIKMYKKHLDILNSVN